MAAKSIKLTVGEQEYTLQFSRRTIMQMEQGGFEVEDILRKPMTMIPRFFHGAFQMHHKGMKQEKTDEIYKSLSGKEQLIDALVDLYNEPLSALIDDPAEGEEKNVSWVLS